MKENLDDFLSSLLGDEPIQDVDLNQLIKDGIIRVVQEPQNALAHLSELEDKYGMSSQRFYQNFINGFAMNIGSQVVQDWLHYLAILKECDIDPFFIAPIREANDNGRIYDRPFYFLLGMPVGIQITSLIFNPSFG